jgi:teichoic acid transport system ATP-binding protein
LRKTIKLELLNITKEFDTVNNNSEKISSLLGINKQTNQFAALRGVTLKAEKDDSIGIIGLNGAGKSTLLNIIAGVYPCTTRIVNIQGKVSLLAIGVGLKPRLTGRENIRYKLAIEGLNNKEIENVIDSIIEFANLGEQIDQRIKSYSSGMKSRLGFSISIHVDPDILIIDESLAVGDATFVNSSITKIEKMKKEGKIIIFVSHGIGEIERICNKAIWLNFGKLVASGESSEVTKLYNEFVANLKKKLPGEEQRKYTQTKKKEQMNFDIDKYNHDLVYKDDNLSRVQKKAMLAKLNEINDEPKVSVLSWVVLIIATLTLFGSVYLQVGNKK